VAVITEAGLHENVAALVYITAFAPDRGESVNTLIAGFPADGPQPPILPPKDDFLFPDRDKFHASFAGDLPAGQAAFMADSQVPWGVNALGGTITEAAWRIAELRALEGAGWVTALRAPDIAALAADDGPLQLSLFDEQNFAEITHPDYPGERLVCCRNPALKVSRAVKREKLLAATEADLGKIKKSVAAGRLKDPDKIGVRVGKAIGNIRSGSISRGRSLAALSASAATRRR